MEFSLILPFLLASLVLVITPGPDLLLLGSITATNGLYDGIRCSLGIFISGMLLTLAVALGLGSLLETMPHVAYFVRSVGAIYFLWLALHYLHRCRDRGSRYPIKNDSLDPTSRSVAPELVGLLSNLFNPKALIFFSLFLPQFVSNSGWSATIQLLLLGSILSTIALIVNIFICFVATRARSIIGSKPSIQNLFDGAAGFFFLYLAYRMTKTPTTA